MFTAKQIKETINANFNTLCIDGFKGQDKLSVQFDDEWSQTIEIVFNASADVRLRQGIHLVNLEGETDLSFKLTDAIQNAFRDGFHTIYIHA